MNLTSAQVATLKAFILADGTLGPKATAGDYQGVADGLNANASPDYFVHRSNVTRVEVYKSTVPAGDSSSGSATTWDWTGYKNQSAPEQDAWKEMFMGGGCDFGNQNNRSGVLAIFGTAGAGGANRTHIFNVAKRRCTVLEKLFVADVPSPPVNTGNVDNDARGAKTNPDMQGIGSDGLPVQGTIQAGDIGGILA